MRAQQFMRRSFERCDLTGCQRRQLQDFFKFTNRCVDAGFHLRQQRCYITGFGRAKPMIAVADAYHLFEQFRVRFTRRLLIGDQTIEIAQIADATHQIAIANASERRITHRRLRREFIRHKRRLPNLHGMQAGWFRLRAKQHHASVGEETVAIANLRLINAARDQVVAQDDVHAFGVFIIDIGDVFAIRRAIGAHELHAGKILRKDFVLAVRQVITAWENEAVAFGQLLTTLADSVDAHRFMSELIVDVIAKLILAVRADLEQDNRV